MENALSCSSPQGLASDFRRMSAPSYEYCASTSRNWASENCMILPLNDGGSFSVEEINISLERSYTGPRSGIWFGEHVMRDSSS